MTNIKKNDVCRVHIEDWSAEGMGVARLGGLVVFVKGGARGDTCDIRILKVAKNAAWARVEQIITPSVHRISSPCPVFPRCGGCDFQDIDYGEELLFKRNRVSEALKRIGGVEHEIDEVIGADVWKAYRNKAVFPVGNREGKTVTGFYRERSHDIVPVDDCLIQPGEANTAVRAVRNWMEEYRIPAYSEETGGGIVRRVFVRANRKGQALVCVSAAAETLPYKKELITRMRDTLPELAGLVLNVNRDGGNAVLAGSFITLWGEPAVEDMLCGLSFRLSVPSFYQINREQAQKLYDRAILYADLDGTKTVLDLYCGTGTITLCMAKLARLAVGVEVVPEAIEDARENARRNGIKNAQFICADASSAVSDFIKEGFRPDVVTVDPPRKGLDESVVESILSLSPECVVYVSCDPGTLARDIKRFSGYNVSGVTVVDMFPRTRHTESCVLLCREKN